MRNKVVNELLAGSRTLPRVASRPPKRGGRLPPSAAGVPPEALFTSFSAFKLASTHLRERNVLVAVCSRWLRLQHLPGSARRVVPCFFLP